jgi:hypothetical protein
LTSAQTWKFIKDKGGIQLYSLHEKSKGLNYFKGIADIKMPVEKIFSKLEDIHQTDWWTGDITQLNILLYEKNKRSQYYLVYDLPWPFKDRDLCVNSTIAINNSTGERKLTSVPLGVCGENKNYVRIKDYWQEWKITPVDNNTSHIELTFYIDPGTSLPDWLVNVVLKDSPIRIINALIKSLK